VPGGGDPAATQGSIVVRHDDASIDEAFHRWAEIYLPNYGWIPVTQTAATDRCRRPGPRLRGVEHRSSHHDDIRQKFGCLSWLQLSARTGNRLLQLEEDTFGFWRLPAAAGAQPTRPPTSRPAHEAQAGVEPMDWRRLRYGIGANGTRSAAPAPCGPRAAGGSLPVAAVRARRNQPSAAGASGAETEGGSFPEE